MCLWNTMPPIMAHSNEGQDHKDKYFDTVTRNDYVQYGSSGILSLRSYEQCHFFLYWSNVKVKRLSTYKNISSQGIFMWNIKVLALTIHKLLARLKFLKSRSNSQVKITRSKILEPMERYYHMGYSCEISKL